MTGSGERRLRQAIRRLARAARALPGRVAGGASLAHRPVLESAEPATDWERATDERLAAIERTITNQNRLLLLTFVSIVGDALYSVAKK